MNIYVTHSRKFDFKKELYTPIRQSPLNIKNHIILPHEFSNTPFNSRSLIISGSLNLILAEVSYESTAQGVELGWADAKEIPIARLFRKDSQPSDSLNRISKFSMPYSNERELIDCIDKVIRTFK